MPEEPNDVDDWYDKFSKKSIEIQQKFVEDSSSLDNPDVLGEWISEQLSQFYDAAAGRGPKGSEVSRVGDGEIEGRPSGVDEEVVRDGPGGEGS